MLVKAKDVITWGEIDDETLFELVKSRGKVGKDKIDESKTQEIAEGLMKGKKKELEIKPFFTLNPPRKGFERKGIKKTFKEGGVLGYRGKSINDLIRKMI